jgi:NAD(P)-dependent dehydrogenase (short-subunit alcohol dehydrogenase family)
VVLITGAGTGIGKAAALAFAKEGASVNDRRLHIPTVGKIRDRKGQHRSMATKKLRPVHPGDIL